MNSNKKDLIVASCVFSGYGLVTNLLIFMIYGFDQPLPKVVINIITEPVSIYLFTILSAFVYGVWSVFTRFGKKTLSNDIWFERIIKNILVSTSNVIINTGVPMACFVGAMGLTSHLLYVLGCTSIDVHSSAYVIFLMIIYILFPILCIMTFINEINNRRLMLNLSVVIYLITNFYLYIYGNEMYKVLGIFGLLVSILIIITIAINCYKSGITKPSTRCL